MYGRLVSSVLFPLQERLKGHDTVRVRRELERSQWWSAERTAEWQVERLRALLHDIREHVPYYKQLFQERSFDPGAVSSLDDLQRLPLLTKADIRRNTEAFKHSRARGLMRFNTGGSSGEPLVFFIGLERVSHDVAAKWRATRWWGVDIGDPEIVLWGSPIELGAQDRVRRWRDRLMRTELLPAFEMSATKLDAFAARIRAARPRMLFGYPSALAHVARHALARSIAMDDLGITVAFVTGERLYDDQRHDIEQVFGCPVANGYGGRDAGFIAHECSHGYMHITAEDVVVEIVNSEGDVLPEGETGEVIVTHLATRDFPFVRYRTGDVAAKLKLSCPCGRGLPILGNLEGRTTDFVVAADGTTMHGLALIYVLRDLPGVNAFRIHQHALDHTTVQLVVTNSFPRELQARLIAGAFRRRLGPHVRVDVDYVAAISAEKSGKFRYVVSDVAAPSWRPNFEQPFATEDCDA